ncbi:hemolysin family protein [Microbacterium karelineae]|uniref:hemolysin family protein n=1 Tax=Microbacterium karelineae TaxID=2654283 RepID=UPI0012E9DF49|nr:hemolysin family protein [Microbacterium karelineae]
MIAAVLLLLVGIVAVLAIIAANGYFVAQEFAYMSVDRSRLRALAESGDAPARRALQVTRRTSFMLSGAQLGITVTGLLVGYVAEPLIGEAIGTLLGGAGIPAGLSITIGTVGALALATIVQMIFGELYPKNLAIASPEPLARGLARSTLVYLTVFGWLIAVFDTAANGLLRLLRIEPVHDIAPSASPEELRRAVADSRESGHLPEELSLLIDRVIDFPDQDVAHAMVPRSRVDTVRADAPADEVRRMMATGHTRYPVVDADDMPVGVIDMAAVLRLDPARGADPASSIMRGPLVVPELMPLPDALARLTAERQQLACVIDEYGGFAGILTTEDLAEELVGELTDEHDTKRQEESIALGDGAWLMDGDLHLDEVRRTVDHPLPDGDFETLAGLVIAARGSFPEPGERVVIDLPSDAVDLVADDAVRRSLDVEVIEVENHVPSALRVRLVETPGEEKEEGA